MCSGCWNRFDAINLLVLLSFLKTRKSIPLLIPFFETLRVPTIYCQQILLDIGAGRLAADL